MAPQIRSLVDPIYRNPPLMDHPHVHRYPSIPGMQQNLFFLIHNEPESHVSESASKYNDHEAQMATSLASYLIMQGIPPDAITILTMYSGQRRKLKECLRKERRIGEDITFVKVSSVDGFQGEESDVIILSLVRSNSMGAIGFLKVANRVCVALSRAKKVRTRPLSDILPYLHHFALQLAHLCRVYRACTFWGTEQCCVDGVNCGTKLSGTWKISTRIVLASI